jgi:Na+-transporting methylmalonyl-CoA/oxaloacetate decarboxylase gamma subunit
MVISTTTLGLGIVIVLVIALALWFMSTFSNANEERREETKSRHMAHQPWDSADGRANR